MMTKNNNATNVMRERAKEYLEKCGDWDIESAFDFCHVIVAAADFALYETTHLRQRVEELEKQLEFSQKQLMRVRDISNNAIAEVNYWDDPLLKEEAV